MQKYWNVAFSISCQIDTIDAPELACTNPRRCYFIGKKHSKLGFKRFRFLSRSMVLYAERRHVIFNPKEWVESPFHGLLNLIRLIDVIMCKTLYNLYWYFTVFYPMILSLFNVLLTNRSILGAAILCK